jgi:hypothetical protein
MMAGSARLSNVWQGDVMKQAIARNIGACLLAFAVICLTATLASACPSCKEALASSDGDMAQGDLVSGFMYSILFMLSMPFAIVGAFGTSMYLAVRKARVSSETASAE